jgi:hypothetical protein
MGGSSLFVPSSRLERGVPGGTYFLSVRSTSGVSRTCASSGVCKSPGSSLIGVIGFATWGPGMRIGLWRVTVCSPTASSSSCLLVLRHGRGASLFGLQILGTLANFRRLLWMSDSFSRLSSTQKFRCPNDFLKRHGSVQTGVSFRETPAFLAGCGRILCLPAWVFSLWRSGHSTAYCVHMTDGCSRALFY